MILHPLRPVPQKPFIRVGTGYRAFDIYNITGSRPSLGGLVPSGFSIVWGEGARKVNDISWECKGTGGEPEENQHGRGNWLVLLAKFCQVGVPSFVDGF